MKAAPMTMTHQRIRLHTGVLSCLRWWITAGLLALWHNVLEEVTADITVRTLLSTSWRCFKACRACLLRWLPLRKSVCCRRGCRRLFADALLSSSSSLTSSAISLSLDSLPLTSATPADTVTKVHYSILTTFKMSLMLCNANSSVVLLMSLLAL